MNETERATFSPDFKKALGFAAELHALQTRKETDIPYISHLIAVSGLVLEHGGGRDEAIAALLHDSIEDCGQDFPGGVAALRAGIKVEFGAAVLGIVEGCTDAETIPKPAWRPRKERYISHLRGATQSVRLVSCADKVHNARSIVADLRVLGAVVFDRFKGGRDGTLWYYAALADEFEARGPADLAGELKRTVELMNSLSGTPN
jgi:(p)ppGpp synthase/HD superfamily hydrolase